MLLFAEIGRYASRPNSFFREFEAKNGSTDVGEDFYGDSEYDMDELDKSGFDGLSEGPMDNPYDDERF